MPTDRRGGLNASVVATLLIGLKAYFYKLMLGQRTIHKTPSVVKAHVIL